MERALARPLRTITIGVLLPLLWSCSSTTTINQNRTNVAQLQANAAAGGRGGRIINDPRTDQDIEKLLPASVFAQKEFPKPYVLDMMRSCTNQVEAVRDTAYRLGKTNEYCSCVTEKRVARYTLQERIAADQAHWDPKLVPEAVKKKTAIIAECVHGISD